MARDRLLDAPAVTEALRRRQPASCTYSLLVFFFFFLFRFVLVNSSCLPAASRNPLGVCVRVACIRSYLSPPIFFFYSYFDFLLCLLPISSSTLKRSPEANAARRGSLPIIRSYLLRLWVYVHNILVGVWDEGPMAPGARDPTLQREGFNLINLILFLFCIPRYVTTTYEISHF